MFTDKEMKFWRLALDHAAMNGEWQNSMVMLGNSLRSRKFLPEHLGAAISSVDWGITTLRFGKHKGEQLKSVPPDYLVWLCDWIDSDADRSQSFTVLRRAISNYLGMESNEQ
jgi:hypothetical protein